jgi:hypothetical protein
MAADGARRSGGNVLKLLLRIDRVQAHLLRHVLGAHGIKAHVFNENMQGAVGEVPVDAALPQVWIDDERDEKRALQVIRQHEVERNRTGSYFCRECKEESPATFDLCWNCGAGLQATGSA